MPDRPYALVRRPAQTLADGIVTFIERHPVELELAKRQWDGYVAALHRSGWPTVVIDADDTMPDCVFVEDTVVMFGDLAVFTNPRQPARNPEVTAVRRTVEDLGFEAAAITEGTLDGGDVLKIGPHVYVGLSGTTDAPAIEQLARLVAPRGYTVTPVPLTRALHLKSAVTALPDGTVIGYAPVVDDPGLFPTFLAVPEEPGAHVVILDDDLLLMSSAAPRTAAMFADRGYRLELVDVSEYEKLEGCVTCLSVRVR
ncbi:N(G),N(G)-dimethylarginine dimethylaminohydrolase [Mycobacterium antarcticum]|uniref:dimethylargininase n=1 Tax=unclassified Mycolicibacterium TaxID=2636767 RepID=UPI0023882F37|nr:MULTISPECIES: dimethylargininase [unclassified Mycolicibacterium]BDX31959.1 N(G),N(G)-dimethylarginine dimethylaminohydrolase [Mycolicibacterium sp. TUM20985]GLP81050.1 N(G),N(G)-dimethylarginine dimethylaminohydrolase [Mycolicibacterium sp. TUM20984]